MVFLGGNVRVHRFEYAEGRTVGDEAKPFVGPKVVDEAGFDRCASAAAVVADPARLHVQVLPRDRLRGEPRPYFMSTECSAAACVAVCQLIPPTWRQIADMHVPRRRDICSTHSAD
jgi:hypothetical protein